jgi:hypothetical protein
MEETIETKTELFREDVLTALRHMDASDVNDIQCDANDAAGRTYEAYYAEHPEIKQLPEFDIDEYGISGFAPAVDAAMSVYEQAIK